MKNETSQQINKTAVNQSQMAQNYFNAPKNSFKKEEPIISSIKQDRPIQKNEIKPNYQQPNKNDKPQ